MAEGEEYVFPGTLEDFGYQFNEEGQLRSIESDEKYEFAAREGDHHYNQKRYNALGDIITEHIYQMMERDCKLQRKYLPVDAEENEPKSFVFMSEDFYKNEDRLMVLVHGSGAVRAGQWARRLIINDCLDSGTQLPYIRWAQENGYAVIVANTNINTVDHPTDKKKKPIKIRDNASPEEHTESLWRDFVQKSKAKHIAIVAHSYGGVCTLELAIKHTSEFHERVFAIALTDSVHSLRQQEATPEVVDLYKERAVNWASAYDDLDTPLLTTQDEVPTVSAGTDRHDYTSFSCMHSIFKYFTEKYEETTNPSRKRVSMGEPSSSSFHSPENSEQQHLITRGQGEGEESPERPVFKMPTNQKPAEVVATKLDSANADDEVRTDPQGQAADFEPPKPGGDGKSKDNSVEVKSEL